MGRRYAAEELYEGEYEEEERTRAAVSSVPSYDDQFEDRTRSARESHVALEGLARSAERARAAFVAPAEIEGERSPAMRARRQSFVDPSELMTTPQRPSFAAASERRSRVERSERPVPGPVPAPPTPRAGSRHSFVASSEREDFASSAPDAEEVTSFRERPVSQYPISQRPASQRPVSQRPASQRPVSQHPVSQRPAASARRASQHPISMDRPVRESTFAPEIESSEIEEVVTRKPAKRASAPASEERSRPVDYEALKNYLFDDVPAGSPEAAAMSDDDRSVSMQTPIAPIAPRATHTAFRPAMHSIRPDGREIAPAARISHHAFRPQMHSVPGTVAPVGASQAPQMAQLGQMPTMPQPMVPMTAPMTAPMMQTQQSVVPAARASHFAFRPPMMTGPVLPQHQQHQQMMAGPAKHESYVDASWIVPTPPFPSSQMAPIKETGSFKVTLSFVAAAVTAVAALAVMIGAILFIRSEDAPPPAPGPGPVVTPVVAVQPPVVAPVEPAKPVVEAPKPVAEKKVAEKPVVEKPVAEKPVVAQSETPKKKKVVVAAAEKDEGEEAPAKPTKPAKKSDKDKQVEAMLAELQEQQLNR